jgi:uncharacterized protein YndB with AHSA1/START domain
MKGEFIAETSVTVNASPAAVWKALTTPALIKKYLFGTDVETDWKEGSAINYTGEYNGSKYHDKGVVKKIIPEKILQTTYWSSMQGKEDKPENYNLVTYVISELDGRSIVTLSQDNISTEKEKEHMIQNWDMVLKKLKEIVETEVK